MVRISCAANVTRTRTSGRSPIVEKVWSVVRECLHLEIFVNFCGSRSYQTRVQTLPERIVYDQGPQSLPGFGGLDPHNAPEHIVQ